MSILKGISTIIAIIIILMIVVFLAALAYLWFTDVFETLTGTGQEQVEETTIRLGSSILIEGVKGDNIYIRNTGKYDVTEIAVYIDDLLTDSTVPDKIEPGKIGTLILSTSISGQHKVKITSKYAETEGWFTFGVRVGNIITVCKFNDCDFTTIQGALDAATEGYVVEIEDGGIYNEYLQITTNSITLDCDDATLESLEYEQNIGINITNVDSVTIENCNLRKYSLSIGIYGTSKSVSITNNDIEGKYGIIFYYSDFNNVSNNKITLYGGNFGGGVVLRSSSNNIISNNEISEISDTIHNTYGIYLLQGSNYNEIIDNNVQEHVYGIFILSSSYNEVINNVGTNNGAGLALDLWSQGNYSWNNTIENNEFFDNRDEGINLGRFAIGTEIRSNVISNNGAGHPGGDGSGIKIYYTSGTEISSNIVCNNFIRDIWCYGSGQSGTGNKADTVVCSGISYDPC